MTVHEEDVARLMRGLTDEEAEAEFRRIEHETQRRFRPFRLEPARVERRKKPRGTPWYVDAWFVFRGVAIPFALWFAAMAVATLAMMYAWGAW